ncbi:hypothetical protein C0991_004470 [Blastosporella zonata]|nr:hypothetical protein C0991_004470 [Blastosporella zonata]
MSVHRPETQPTTYRTSLRALLFLPFRLCNPPPAVGKVRSCGVTPLIKIRLEDILDRKHLPPLGLKDFEEWLLYVENCPENLYFILWLKEYTVKYHQWAAATKARKQTVGYLQDQTPAPSASHLSVFYARAKQTFFMPNSIYELDIPSDILAPFHTTDLCYHPDPFVFHQVSQEVNKMLEQCLSRFLAAQLTNVGNNRVLCGIIAGVIILLAGAIPPVVVNFTRGQPRWERVTAFPGMWIGLSVLVAAINGICLGVYIFGDLRQLRKFELERPPISKPKALGKATLPLFAPPVSRNTGTPHTPAPFLAPPSPPPPVHIAERRLSRTPTMSSTTSSSSVSSSSEGSSAESHLMIEISGAYYDAQSVDDDPYYYSPEANLALNEKTEDGDSIFPPRTAAFIHPYDSTIDLDLEENSPKFLPQERQPISPFNFDALPPRTSSGYTRSSSIDVKSPIPTHELLEIKSDIPPLSKVSAASIIEQFQLRCIPKKWLVVNREAPVPDNEKEPGTPRSSFGHDLSRPERAAMPTAQRQQNIDFVQKQFKKVKAVPPFTHLTRILSPVVVRGHWEIVVRSTAIAFMITWLVVGCLLAAPVPR